MKSGFDALLVFMRYPEAGKAKKRLSKVIGAARAVEIYEKLLRRTLGIAWEFHRRNPGARIFLFHTPGDPVDLLGERFAGPWDFRSQQGEHLGVRMEKALDSALSMGADKAVLIGSDIFDLECEDIEEAFRRLDAGTAVLNPAADGGFYLIGLRDPCRAPFDFAQWGGSGIYARTAHVLEASGFRVRSGKERKDVDHQEDLHLLDGSVLFQSALSVIIPTLSEPHELEPLLRFLDNSIWPGDEIILVRGGSACRDCSAEIFGRTKSVLSPLGRGLQQNTGAMLAKGNLFFFLHDDSVPPSDFAYLVRKASENRGVSLGCFRLAFKPSSPSLRLIEAWANLRTAFFRAPYGDQGLFCRKEIFERVGGFRRRYLMEDVDFVKECRKIGKLSILPLPVYSSPKRYLNKGILSASLQNHATKILFSLGFDERKLYHRYYGLECTKEKRTP